MMMMMMMVNIKAAMQILKKKCTGNTLFSRIILIYALWTLLSLTQSKLEE